MPHPPRLPEAFSAIGDPPVFIYLKVPIGRRDADPLHLREEQIDQALRAQAAGAVVGWGQSLGGRPADGRRMPSFTRIDITAPALDAARTALQALLPTLDTPLLTEIHYTRDEQLYMDLLTAEGWQQGLLAPGPHGAGKP